MSISCETGKQIQHNCSSHSEDEEESLSLCDLPLTSTTTDHETEQFATKPQKRVSEDFDFGSISASLDVLESEMCAADEVFFGGQILPFRHSVSSSSNAVTRTVSRSESTGSGFRSSSTASSSRSSSTRSSSINSSASAGKLPPPSTNWSVHKRESKIRNQFHSFPSPKPYARAASAPRPGINKRSSSALWEIFRLGIVRTPEIELEDLKIRKQRNVGSRGGSENGKSVNKGKKKGVGLVMNCKCSAEVVEPEKGKVVEPEKGKVVGNKEERRRKQDVSRHYRTFQWLKELPHAVVLNDT